MFLFRSALCALLATLCIPAAHAAEDVRSLAPFRAIAITGPINLEVHAGKAQSFRIIGRDAFIGKIRTQVRDGELRIEFTDSKNMSVKDGDKIVITMPSLVKCIVEGAGQVVVDNLDEDRVDLQFEGAGRLAAQGRTKWLRLKALGVGQVDTKGLKAERTDVNFEGIGEVSIHASQTLNAVVRGMGNLVYYGHPKTLNKSAMGFGEIKAGD